MAWFSPMSIYVWNKGWRVSYSSGVVAVVASSVDEARELARAKLEDWHSNKEECEAALMAEPAIFPVDKPAVVVDEYGGD
jgi:hypothetical protein